MGLFHSPKIITDGLIAYFDAANAKSYPGSGTTCNSMVSTNSGSFSGSVQHYDVNLGLFSFVGNGLIDTDLLLTGSDLSIIVWFRGGEQTSLSNSSLRPIVIQGNFVEPNEAVEITMLRSGSVDHGKIRYSIGDDDAGNHLTTLPYNDSEWHCAALAKNGTNGKAYMDGEYLADLSGTTLVNTLTNVQIGGSSTNIARKFTGDISLVQIYNRSLTQDEIKTNYGATRGRYLISEENSQLSIVTSGLVMDLDAYYTASNPGAGTTWFDLQGNYDHGLYNGASFTTVDGAKCVDCTGNRYVRDLGTTYTFGSAHTIMAWARPLSDAQVATWRTLFRTQPNDHPLIIQDGTNLIGFYDNNGGGFVSYGLNLGTLGLENTWTLFTLVATGGSTTLYINDGTNNGTVAYTTFTNQQDAIGNLNGGGQPFGYVGDTKIYNRALSLSEIQQNFEATRARYSI